MPRAFALFDEVDYLAPKLSKSFLSFLFRKKQTAAANEISPHITALMDNYGVRDGENVWSNNILATDAVRLANRTFRRRLSDESPSNESAAKEHASLARLASEIASVADGMETGMGSQGSEGFEPFFINRVFSVVDEDGMRAIWNDALYPEAEVSVEPMDEGASLWRQVVNDCDDDKALLLRWKEVFEWFHKPSRFVDTWLVSIDAEPPEDTFVGDVSGGCVFPRLLLGRTKDGRLVGLLGVVVYT